LRTDGEPTAALTDHFRSRLPEIQDLSIAGLERSSQGWSDETLVLSVHGRAGGEPVARGFALRCYKSGGLLRSQTDLRRQYRVLECLGSTPIPSPRVYWFEADPTILGGPFFVMERIDGYAPQPWSPDGQRFMTELRADAAAQEEFVHILAEIHRLDWRAAGLGFLGEPAPGAAFALGEAAKLEQLLDEYRLEPEPILRDAVGWLHRHAPPAEQFCLIHGDYRTGNLIYADHETKAVVDWEFASIGDPHFDLAWVCARANRMDSPYVCYLMEQEAFLDRYADLTGWAVDAGRLHYYEVLLHLRHAAIFFTAGHAYVRGQTEDLRMARAAAMLPLLREMVAELLEYGYA
jgi:aminoglycoside phosphotransferase (APT) family kinase protein